MITDLSGLASRLAQVTPLCRKDTINWIHIFRDGNGSNGTNNFLFAINSPSGQLLAGEPTIAD